jgi:hypothetical protein
VALAVCVVDSDACGDVVAFENTFYCSKSLWRVPDVLSDGSVAHNTAGAPFAKAIGKSDRAPNGDGAGL